MSSPEPAEIYLDSCATTPLDPRVAVAMAEAESAGFANPASPHRAGRRAKKLLEEAREGIAQLLDAPWADAPGPCVVFTSGGTEANNLALLGMAGDSPGRIVISSIEHPSVDGPAAVLTARGYDVQRARVNQQGVLDLEHAVSLLTPQTRLVSVMLGNNETGVLQPVAELAAECQRRDIPLHTDAVQAIGKISVGFSGLRLAALSLSGHKFHGPRGIGALVVSRRTQPRPLFLGGFQQAGIRPGTEPVGLVVGLFAALRIAHDELAKRSQYLRGLQQQFEGALLSLIPEATVLGAAAGRLPHVSNVSFPGLDRQALLMALDLAGIGCSSGSACASGSSERSPVLTAMGLCDEVLDSALRFSWSVQTEAGEIDESVRRILLVVNKLRQQNSAENPDWPSRQRTRKTVY